MKFATSILFVLLLITINSDLVNAQDLSGPLSGTLGPGSYNVVDSIHVDPLQTLTILPGTTFNFTGAFGFGIVGTLIAEGTETDSIKFMPAFGVPFWKGIDVDDIASNVSFSYCYFTGANTSAIFNSSENISIKNSYFYNNTSLDMGGGIYSQNGSGEIASCVFDMGYSENGGGVALQFAAVDVINCIFTNNIGTFGGAMALYFVGVLEINNCLFDGNLGNNAGGGIRLSSSGNATISNSTFVNNMGGNGPAIYVINQTPTLNNSIVRNNTGTSLQIHTLGGGLDVSYCSVEDQLWAGQGNITSDPLFVTGPGGAYYLSQIAAGQGSDSPCVDAGNPATSLTGTTRTDEVLDDGTVDMGYHYLYEETPIMMAVTLTPVSLPIQIPANGGSFDFNIMVENNSPGTMNCDVWTMATLPSGSEYGPIINANITLNSGASVDRDRTQNVPASAPSGNYTYDGYVGVYPSEIYAEDHFDFEKLADDNGGTVVTEWVCWGESLEKPEEISLSTVSEYSLNSAYPNPFNPETTISYSLPEFSHVSLKIYNNNGREVATLIDGYRNAGMNEVMFDGSYLTSGVYFAVMTAGNFNAVHKLLLVK